MPRFNFLFHPPLAATSLPHSLAPIISSQYQCALLYSPLFCFVALRPAPHLPPDLPSKPSTTKTLCQPFIYSFLCAVLRQSFTCPGVGVILLYLMQVNQNNKMYLFGIDFIPPFMYSLAERQECLTKSDFGYDTLAVSLRLRGMEVDFR